MQAGNPWSEQIRQRKRHYKSGWKAGKQIRLYVHQPRRFSTICPAVLVYVELHQNWRRPSLQSPYFSMNLFAASNAS